MIELETAEVTLQTELAQAETTHLQILEPTATLIAHKQPLEEQLLRDKATATLTTIDNKALTQEMIATLLLEPTAHHQTIAEAVVDLMVAETVAEAEVQDHLEEVEDN